MRAAWQINAMVLKNKYIHMRRVIRLEIKLLVVDKQTELLHAHTLIHVL